jgi:hypothetical protein
MQFKVVLPSNTIENTAGDSIRALPKRHAERASAPSIISTVFCSP